MSHKVFFSYAFQDRALAESIKSIISELLSQNEKGAVDIFDVQVDTTGEKDIRQSIKSAIDEARTVVIISSESADASPSVNYEVGLADAMGKNLVFVGKKGVEDTALLRRFSDSAKVIRIEND